MRLDSNTRISYQDMFLVEALMWSLRSHDVHTKCGCVLVDKDNSILSTGYNGFIRNIDDSVLPLTRPEKYPYMVHSEANAIYNCARQGKSTFDATAYITGIPCTTCLQAMYQAGISKIIYSNFNQPKMCEEQVESFRLLTELMKDKMQIIFIPKEKIKLNEVVTWLNSKII